MSMGRNCEQMSDEDLAAKVLDDQDFYICLMERYERPLKRYLGRISSLSSTEIEDLLQEVFIKAYLNLNDFDRRLKFSSWIYRLAHNQAIDHHRKRSARHLDEMANLEDWQDIPSGISLELELDHMLTAEQIRKVLAEMDEKYREILVLKFLEEKNYDEISDILRKPAGTIATHINRAKKQFREISLRANMRF